VFLQLTVEGSVNLGQQHERGMNTASGDYVASADPISGAMGGNAMEAVVGITLPPASCWACIWPPVRCGHSKDSGEHLTVL
jgi:hypothetical protein